MKVFPLSPHSGSLETKKRSPVGEKAPSFIWLHSQHLVSLTDEITHRDSGHQLLHQGAINLPAFPGSRSSDSASCRSERNMTRSAWARVPVLRTRWIRWASPGLKDFRPEEQDLKASRFYSWWGGGASGGTFRCPFGANK